MIGVKRPASVFAASSVKNSDRSSIPVSDQLDEIFKMSRGEEHEEKGFESIDSVLEACPKKSKVGMKYELHSVSSSCTTSLSTEWVQTSSPNFIINYNTVRNIQSLFLKQRGETYKHVRMYSDINNVALKVATRSDLGLVERLEPRTNCKEQQLQAPKVCSLYLHADGSVFDHSSQRSMKVFCLHNEFE